MNNIQKLEQLGQSIWYDNISRGLIVSNGLKKLVDGGLMGVTSNPTIFDKAISGTKDYDQMIRELVIQSAQDPGQSMSVDEIIRALMVRDIQMACDVLAPVFDRANGRDGFVSVEVTPSKARDTKATSAEVRLLWGLIDRKNLMVKIPATKEGLPAIAQAISEGININVTLIFSVERYREVADAYITGLERGLAAGKPVAHVASVASIFVSRIDTLVDGLLAKKIASAPASQELEALKGKAAVANTKMVYKAFREIFSSPRFLALKEKGAMVQRPLWASTGTKNPAYKDVKYIDELIGEDTVNTVPPATYDAILDHCVLRRTVEEDLAGASESLAGLKAAGIDMRQVTDTLEQEGVASFEKSFDGLFAGIEAKRKAILND